MSSWLAAGFLLLAVAAPARAADVDNCLVCHRYAGLSAVDEDGALRLFYVNEDLWDQSVHIKPACDGCHVDIEELPHGTVSEVSCTEECHIEEPSTERRFSHAHAADELADSVHAPFEADGTPKPYPEDYPTCKDCHDDPRHRPLSFYKTVQDGVSEVALGRCRVCHEDEAFIHNYYNHITSRLHPLRSPTDIADMCSRCHDDPELIARHDLKSKAVLTYEATFHGKAASLENEAIPDCLDCHVEAGTSIHSLRGKDDEASPVHASNRDRLCSQSQCHPNVNARASNYQVHAEFNAETNTGMFWTTVFFHFLAGGTLMPLYGIILLDLLRRHLPGAVFLWGK